MKECFSSVEREIKQHGQRTRHPEKGKGIDMDNTAGISTGKGVIAKVLSEGESYFSDDPIHTESQDTAKPVVCIPLKWDQRTCYRCNCNIFISQPEDLGLKC